MSSYSANEYSTFVSETPKSVTPKSVTPKSVTTNIEKISNIPKRKPFNLNKFIKNFGKNNCPPCDKAATGRYIYSVFHSIMALIAIYLSFRCNNGFSLGPFFISMLCPYIYIIYIVATRGTCGIFEKI